MLSIRKNGKILKNITGDMLAYSFNIGKQHKQCCELNMLSGSYSWGEVVGSHDVILGFLIAFHCFSMLFKCVYMSIHTSTVRLYPSCVRLLCPLSVRFPLSSPCPSALSALCPFFLRSERSWKGDACKLLMHLDEKLI